MGGSDYVEMERRTWAGLSSGSRTAKAKELWELRLSRCSGSEGQDVAQPKDLESRVLIRS